MSQIETHPVSIYDPKPRIDVAGQRFGRLVPVAYLGSGYWECWCDCGVTCTVTVTNLKRQVSCGCYRLELARNQPRKSAEHLKTMDRARSQRYRKTDKFKRTRAAYEASEQGKANRAKWAASEKCKMLARVHNPEKKARRRALMRGLDHHLSRREWRAIKQAWDQKCAYCRVGSPREREHVLALTKGGADDIFNVVPACRRCNAIKYKKCLNDVADKLKINLDEFAALRERMVEKTQRILDA